METARLARGALAVLLLGIYSTLGAVRRITEPLREANLLRLTVGAVFLVVVGAVVVALVSSGAFRRPRLWFAATVAFAAYAAVIWPMESPEEKLHFVEYGLVGLGAFFAAPLRLSELGRFSFASLFTAAAGLADEGIQALLPNRYADWRDVGFNALAGVMALGALALFRWGRGTARS